MKVRQNFVILSTVSLIIIFSLSLKYQNILWSLVIVMPITLLGYKDMFQKKQAIKRNYPVIGNFRYLLEKIRPEIMQYFVETNTEGRPINRIFRALVYQRAKKVNDTTPFGTQMDVYNEGYEWMEHSVYAKSHSELDKDPRVIIGGPDCKHPYSSSLLNISAMSYGSLSKNAVLAMNGGAKIGHFAQNTGEGGVSPFHLQPGGDLIWQIGTGYFGCRTKEGGFCAESFKNNALKENVKMIELKISQGAKPGHGGILPAVKNTVEIAQIRGVEPHMDIHSPPSHAEFNSAAGMMKFIKKLRDLSDGKPIGIKLCIGKEDEFIELCEVMKDLNITPDFIAVDGGEGGTGAAPVEFSNSLGMPLRDGLSFVINTLNRHGLRDQIKVMASGKVFSAFHMARLIAIGADSIYSARAIMLATGCIQALQCNSNSCPVGIATQSKSLMKGLDVEDKAQRVANFHQETIKAFNELLAASGLIKPNQLTRDHIIRRVNMNQTMKYSEIYPST